MFNDTFVFSTSSNSLRSSFPTEKIQRLFSKINNVKVAPVVKNSPASTGDVKVTGLIPGSGRSPEGGNGYPSSVLAWRIPRTEEPGGLQPTVLQRIKDN